VELVVIFGPPAVGKMTVGEELCAITDYKLFHNHMTIEPVLDIFPFGSPAFDRLVGEFRRRVIEEAADGDIPGLVFTFVWGLELKDDRAVIESYVDIVESRGGRVSFVELWADQPTRLDRNETPLRQDRKRSKRDAVTARRLLLALDDGYVLSTSNTSFTIAQAVLDKHRYLRIDNSALSATATADAIANHFGMPGSVGP
jgi:hypothetical protein